MRRLPYLLIALGGGLLLLGFGFYRQNLSRIDISPTQPVPPKVAAQVTIQLPLPTADPATASPTETPPPPATRTPQPTRATPTITAVPAIPFEERFGVTVANGYLREAEAAGLRYGSVLNWQISTAPRPNYWQMLRLSEAGVQQNWQEIEQAIAANPGAFWVIGNEPDVTVQDNVTPERYAEIYHEAYTFIKTRDPQAQIVIGGVTQPSPLRQIYLERILVHYQELYGEPMPVDVWNVHAFILNEERNGWGAGIPPGINVDEGERLDLQEHDDMERFTRQIVEFRRWMVEWGYQDRPLVISEYGILMPPDYGFDAQRTALFLQNTLEFFVTAQDETIGFPQDDFRLVQWWFWYTVYDTPEWFPAGNLYDPDLDELTPAGEAYADYLR